MNYLQLCQAVARRAGVSGSHTPKPVTVEGQTGKLALLCDYVAEAARDVETSWADFTFMRAEIDFSVPADAQYIQPADQHSDIERFESQSFTVRDEDTRQRVRSIPWETYRQTRVINIETTDGLPTHCSIDRQGRIHFSPVSSRAFIFRADVVLKPAALLANDDEPRVPADYRDVIVHRALMLYYSGDEAFNNAQASGLDYERWMERVEDRFLPHNAHGRTQSNETPMVMITE